jgi:integral membrane sensor domain MASE1
MKLRDPFFCLTQQAFLQRDQGPLFAALGARAWLIQFGFITIACFGLALLSLWMNALSGQASAIWIPNAPVLAALCLTGTKYRRVLLIGHFIGVCMALLAMQIPVAAALAFGVIATAQAAFGAVLFGLALGADGPLDTEQSYLRFLTLVAVPTAILGAVPGAAVLHMLFEVPFVTGFSRWVTASALSLIGLTPVFMWLFACSRRRSTFDTSQKWWTLGCGVSLSSVLSAVLWLGAPLEGVFVMTPVCVMFARQMGRVGAMTLTALLLPFVAVLGIVRVSDLL